VTSRKPARKVAAGGISAAVTALLIAGLDLAGVEVTPALASAITTVAGFAVAYLTPPVPEVDPSWHAPRPD
jgi:hypothetical protein